MATLAPAQRTLRASCNGVMIRLRINVDSAWITISQPGHEPFYRDIEQSELPALMAEFRAINGSSERFNVFVNGVGAAV